MSYRSLLRDAEYFCEQAEAVRDDGSPLSGRFSSASVLFSFIAVESFINNMLADFVSLPESMFTVHEQGFLAERGVVFCTSGDNAGRFELTTRQEYRSLEDKIMFLIARFGGDTVDKGSSLWQRFERAKAVRNQLTHPRKGVEVLLTPSDARGALQVASDVVRLVSAKVWGKSVDL